MRLNLIQVEQIFENSKEYKPEGWEKKKVEEYGVKCSCGHFFQLYELDMVGYKAGRCWKCGEVTVSDTNIIVVLQNIASLYRLL